jgi:hypothetical protein
VSYPLRFFTPFIDWEARDRALDDAWRRIHLDDSWTQTGTQMAGGTFAAASSGASYLYGTQAAAGANLFRVSGHARNQMIARSLHRSQIRWAIKDGKPVFMPRNLKDFLLSTTHSQCTAKRVKEAEDVYRWSEGRILVFRNHFTNTIISVRYESFP